MKIAIFKNKYFNQAMEMPIIMRNQDYSNNNFNNKGKIKTNQTNQTNKTSILIQERTFFLSGEEINNDIYKKIGILSVFACQNFNQVFDKMGIKNNEWPHIDFLNTLKSFVIEKSKIVKKNNNPSSDFYYEFLSFLELIYELLKNKTFQSEEFKILIDIINKEKESFFGCLDAKESYSINNCKNKIFGNKGWEDKFSETNVFNFYLFFKYHITINILNILYSDLKYQKSLNIIMQNLINKEVYIINGINLNEKKEKLSCQENCYISLNMEFYASNILTAFLKGFSVRKFLEFYAIELKYRELLTKDDNFFSSAIHPKDLKKLIINSELFSPNAIYYNSQSLYSEQIIIKMNNMTKGSLKTLTDIKERPLNNINSIDRNFIIDYHKSINDFYNDVLLNFYNNFMTISRDLCNVFCYEKNLIPQFSTLFLKFLNIYLSDFLKNILDDNVHKFNRTNLNILNQFLIIMQKIRVSSLSNHFTKASILIENIIYTFYHPIDFEFKNKITSKIDQINLEINENNNLLLTEQQKKNELKEYIFSTLFIGLTQEPTVKIKKIENIITEKKIEKDIDKYLLFISLFLKFNSFLPNLFGMYDYLNQKFNPKADNIIEASKRILNLINLLSNKVDDIFAFIKTLEKIYDFFNKENINLNVNNLSQINNESAVFDYSLFTKTNYRLNNIHFNMLSIEIKNNQSENKINSFYYLIEGEISKIIEFDINNLQPDVIFNTFCCQANYNATNFEKKTQYFNNLFEKYFKPFEKKINLILTDMNLYYCNILKFTADIQLEYKKTIEQKKPNNQLEEDKKKIRDKSRRENDNLKNQIDENCNKYNTSHSWTNKITIFKQIEQAALKISILCNKTDYFYKEIEPKLEKMIKQDPYLSKFEILIEKVLNQKILSAKTINKSIRNCELVNMVFSIIQKTLDYYQLKFFDIFTVDNNEFPRNFQILFSNLFSVTHRLLTGILHQQYFSIYKLYSIQKFLTSNRKIIKKTYNMPMPNFPKFSMREKLPVSFLVCNEEFLVYNEELKDSQEDFSIEDFYNEIKKRQNECNFLKKKKAIIVNNIIVVKELVVSKYDKKKEEQNFNINFSKIEADFNLAKYLFTNEKNIIDEQIKDLQKKKEDLNQKNTALQSNQNLVDELNISQNSFNIDKIDEEIRKFNLNFEEKYNNMKKKENDFKIQKEEYANHNGYLNLMNKIKKYENDLNQIDLQFFNISEEINNLIKQHQSRKIFKEKQQNMQENISEKNEQKQQEILIQTKQENIKKIEIEIQGINQKIQEIEQEIETQKSQEIKKQKEQEIQERKIQEINQKNQEKEKPKEKTEEKKSQKKPGKKSKKKEPQEQENLKKDLQEKENLKKELQTIEEIQKNQEKEIQEIQKEINFQENLKKEKETQKINLQENLKKEIEILKAQNMPEQKQQKNQKEKTNQEKMIANLDQINDFYEISLLTYKKILTIEESQRINNAKIIVMEIINYYFNYQFTIEEICLEFLYIINQDFLYEIVLFIFETIYEKNNFYFNQFTKNLSFDYLENYFEECKPGYLSQLRSILQIIKNKAMKKASNYQFKFNLTFDLFNPYKLIIDITEQKYNQSEKIKNIFVWDIEKSKIYDAQSLHQKKLSDLNEEIQIIDNQISINQEKNNNLSLQKKIISIPEDQIQENKEEEKDKNNYQNKPQEYYSKDNYQLEQNPNELKNLKQDTTTKESNEEALQLLLTQKTNKQRELNELYILIWKENSKIKNDNIAIIKNNSLNNNDNTANKINIAIAENEAKQKKEKENFDENLKNAEDEFITKKDKIETQNKKNEFETAFKLEKQAKQKIYNYNIKVLLDENIELKAKNKSIAESKEILFKLFQLLSLKHRNIEMQKFITENTEIQNFISNNKNQEIKTFTENFYNILKELNNKNQEIKTFTEKIHNILKGFGHDCIMAFYQFEKENSYADKNTEHYPLIYINLFEYININFFPLFNKQNQLRKDFFYPDKNIKQYKFEEISLYQNIFDIIINLLNEEIYFDNPFLVKYTYYLFIYMNNLLGLFFKNFGIRFKDLLLFLSDEEYKQKKLEKEANFNIKNNENFQNNEDQFPKFNDLNKFMHSIYCAYKETLPKIKFIFPTLNIIEDEFLKKLLIDKEYFLKKYQSLNLDISLNKKENSYNLLKIMVITFMLENFEQVSFNNRKNEILINISVINQIQEMEI